MSHQLSQSDRAFHQDFMLGRITPAQFDHRAHVRLAYVLLCESGVDQATERMRAALVEFITRNGVNPAKFHETITRAWILAVRHFMDGAPSSGSADEFIDANPRLLDPKIMLTHYSAQTLFSDEARVRFVPPDLQQIPGGESSLA